MLSTYSSYYIPRRSRLYAWRIDIEIRFLRFLTAAIRAVHHEDWRAVVLLCGAAWLAGIIGAVGALAVLPY